MKIILVPSGDQEASPVQTGFVPFVKLVILVSFVPSIFIVYKWAISFTSDENRILFSFVDGIVSETSSVLLQLVNKIDKIEIVLRMFFIWFIYYLRIIYVFFYSFALVCRPTLGSLAM